MLIKLIRIFFIISAVLLLMTAAAKLVSSSGTAPILAQIDPILRISYRHLLWLVGGIELAMAGLCLFGKQVWLQAGLLACLATNFMIYRLGIHSIGIHFCSCLGSLAESLPISKTATDSILAGILAYLLIGSYAILLWLWVGRCRTSPA